MSTGYYRPEMTPPEYEGKTWPYRMPYYEDGEQRERTIQSPFPPATIGNPAEDVPEFDDFKRWASRNRKAEHPDWYCQTCGASLSEPAMRLKRRQCALCLGWTARDLEAEAKKIGVHLQPTPIGPDVAEGAAQQILRADRRRGLHAARFDGGRR